MVNPVNDISLVFRFERPSPSILFSVITKIRGRLPWNRGKFEVGFNWHSIYRSNYTSEFGESCVKKAVYDLNFKSKNLFSKINRRIKTIIAYSLPLFEYKEFKTNVIEEMKEDMITRVIATRSADLARKRAEKLK